MLTAYRVEQGTLHEVEDGALDRAIWIDLFMPTDAEVAMVAALEGGQTIPTLAEMQEIEISSRLYREAEVSYMTVLLPGRSIDEDPVAGPVTFILDRNRLITVRHHNLRPLETYPRHAGSSPTGCATAGRVFLGLCDEIIGRLADLLEEIGRTLDGLSETVFSGDPARSPEQMRGDLGQIGRQGELQGRIRLGLLTLERALSFHDQTLGPGDKAMHGITNILQRDIAALAEHANFVSSRISLINDAALGMINIEQNAIVRIFSVVAVLFMPPTLVASVYGMNFRFMPELALPWGYPLALALIVVSALLTYFLFKWRRWL